MRIRRSARTLTTLGAATGLIFAACTNGSSGPTVHTGGILGFDQTAAVSTNGPIPPAGPVGACGSDTATFAAELIDTPPQSAKVQKEWGDVIPNKLMLVSGTISRVVLSSGDLIFDHPFNLDLTFDVRPDRPFEQLAQLRGVPVPAGPLGTIHMEIPQGLLPHSDTNSVRDFMPGFTPQKGDRVAVYGRWIVDCGHNDYHTEIHPVVFLAFAHRDGSSTIVHAFYSPYYDTQLYVADPNLAAQVTNDSRLQVSATTKPFPAALVQVLLRVGRQGPPGFCCLDRLSMHEALGANTASPLAFYACAETTGDVSVAYDFVTRPGVTVSAEPAGGSGCLQVRARITPAYEPVDPRRKDCVDPWAQLTAQAADATGDESLDIKKLIEAKVPASFVQAIERDPVVDCFDPLTGPALPQLGSETRVSPDANQPFPFYGWVKVTPKG